MKYLAIISYDGSKFHGFQRQKKERNVQGTIEQYLKKFFNEEILIKASGRTDALVHAKHQVISFETKKKIKNLKSKFNKDNKDIRIKKIKKVSYNFHPRFDVKEKTYLYKLDLTGNRDINYFSNTYYKLNLNKMKEVSKIFIGTHDFHNFVSGERLDSVTTIKKIKIIKFNNVIYFKFVGVGFYRYMVRNLVGALIDVGRNKVLKCEIEQMLNKDFNRSLSTAKPSGLYLYKVKY